MVVTATHPEIQRRTSTADDWPTHRAFYWRFLAQECYHEGLLRVRRGFPKQPPSVALILHGNETQMTLPLQTRDLAQRLLVYGGAAGKASESVEFPAIRVCEKLRQPLCALSGVAGFRSLLSRALTLARAEAPSLSAVQVAPDGSLRCPDGLEAQFDADQAREAAVTLIAHLLAALLLYIGEAMMLQLVTSEILPDFKFLPPGSVPVGFEGILNEIDQLQGVSTRLEGLAEQYPPVTEALTMIAGNVRHTATVLAVVAAIKCPKPN